MNTHDSRVRFIGRSVLVDLYTQNVHNYSTNTPYPENVYILDNLPDELGLPDTKLHQKPSHEYLQAS